METISKIRLYRKDLIPEKNEQGLELTLNAESVGRQSSYNIHIINEDNNDIYSSSFDSNPGILGEEVVNHIKQSEYIIWLDYKLLLKKPDDTIDRTTEIFRHDIEAEINLYIHENMGSFDGIPDKEPAEPITLLVLDA